MALTILFKFCVYIVHSKSNNMTLSAFPGKILETRKIVFNILLRNVAPKPTDQSCSNAIFGVPLQIFPVSFSFDQPSKWRVVHIRKKIKIFVYWKTPSTIFIKMCRFIVVYIGISTIWHSRLFPENPWNWKSIFLIFYPSVA